MLDRLDKVPDVDNLEPLWTCVADLTDDADRCRTPVQELSDVQIDDFLDFCDSALLRKRERQQRMSVSVSPTNALTRTGKRRGDPARLLPLESRRTAKPAPADLDGELADIYASHPLAVPDADADALAPAEAYNRYRAAAVTQYVPSDPLPAAHTRLLNHLASQLRVPAIELEAFTLKMAIALEAHVAATYADERKASKATKPKAKLSRSHVDTTRIKAKARADNIRRNESRPDPRSIRSKEMISDDEDT